MLLLQRHGSENRQHSPWVCARRASHRSGRPGGTDSRPMDVTTAGPPKTAGPSTKPRLCSITSCRAPLPGNYPGIFCAACLKPKRQRGKIIYDTDPETHRRQVEEVERFLREKRAEQERAKEAAVEKERAKQVAVEKELRKQRKEEKRRASVAAVVGWDAQGRKHHGGRTEKEACFRTAQSDGRRACY